MNWWFLKDSFNGLSDYVYVRKSTTHSPIRMETCWVMVHNSQTETGFDSPFLPSRDRSLWRDHFPNRVRKKIHFHSVMTLMGCDWPNPWGSLGFLLLNTSISHGGDIIKVSYRSMDTTGNPVDRSASGTYRWTTSPARAGTGEPLHRLEPVPVRGSFPPVIRFSKWQEYRSHRTKSVGLYHPTQGTHIHLNMNSEVRVSQTSTIPPVLVGKEKKNQGRKKKPQRTGALSKDGQKRQGRSLEGWAKWVEVIFT
jgi:hypothetical protein